MSELARCITKSAWNVSLFCLLGVNCSSDANASLSAGVEYRRYIEQSSQSYAWLISFDRDWSSRDGKQLFYLEAFARVDDHDHRRSYVDLNEAHWKFWSGSWEISAGIATVFWGVMESNHLVDIINQTNLAGSPDGEEKLGQPMVRMSYSSSNDTFELFLLPYFRERVFPSSDDPLSGFINVIDDAVYETSNSKDKVDLALRYAVYMGAFDGSVYYFQGTSREPILLDLRNPELPESFSPFYEEIVQVGVSGQITLDQWLWKFEAIQRRGSLQDFAAISYGFEHTFFDVHRLGLDIGLVAELSSETGARVNESILQDDIFLGARIALNDVHDTQLLVGVANDVEKSGSRFVTLEASRRVGHDLKLSVESMLFTSREKNDPLYLLQGADFFLMTLEYYF